MKLLIMGAPGAGKGTQAADLAQYYGVPAISTGEIFRDNIRNQTPLGKGQLGLSLRPLQPQEARQAGVEQGLLIEQAQGPAAKAGIQPGDVLLAINGTPAKDVEQVREAIAKAGKSVALLVQRDGTRIFVPVQLG